MGVLLGIDNESYSYKPVHKYEYNEIRKRAAANWKEGNISIFKKKIGQNGHAFVSGHLIGGESSCNCTEMQVFALDFDNDKYYISIDSVINRCNANNIYPTFAYHTLSSTDEHNRFRVVFITEESITDTFVIPVIFHMLLTIFPEADHACKDSARLFLGGKKLIFCNEDARLNLQCLIESTETVLCKDVSHRKERLSSFANKTNIQKINSMPAMGPLDQMDLFFRDFKDPTINKYIHIVGENTNSPIFILERSKLALDTSTCKDTALHKINPNDYSACTLLKEFQSGDELDHNERFLLLTNLIHINGGVAMFKETLLRFYDKDTNDKWDKVIQSVKYHKYHPALCDSYCPYAKECDHASTPLYTLLSDRKISRTSEPIYCTLAEAEQQLTENLENALRSKKKGIHLISAQTGLGKTTMYTQAIANTPSMRAIVALPTNKLKEEVHDRLLDLGIPESEIFVTPHVRDNPFIPLDAQEAVSEMHEHGVHNQTKTIIGNLLDTSDPECVAEKQELRRILNGMKNYRNERIILTTHAYFMHMPQTHIQDKTVIIDEDILLNLFFNRIYTASLSDLQKLRQTNQPGYQQLASCINAAPFETYCRLDIPAKITDTESNELLTVETDSNLIDLKNVSSFVKHRSEAGDYVRYFCRSRLPVNKYIVLSATLDKEIYEKYFPNLQIISYPYKEARYKGTLNQYTYHSLGRGDLDSRLEDVCLFVKDHFESQFVNLISFKKIFDNNTVKKNNLAPRMNFGNTMGFNELSGQNLAIVGTYFKQEDAYKLVATSMGADVNKKENRHPRQRRVEYAGYSFVLMTYADYLLRRIQLYSIMSEQEQSVGRARLLRENCEVLLLSAFPCSQAHLRTREYLC